MGRTITVKIVDLKPNLFVRQSISDDRVVYLAELIEAGTEVDPIQITAGRVVIDGRHRIRAHELLDRKDLKAEIVEVEDEIELIGLAYRANLGGALPPTPDDTEHTVMELVKRDETVKRISELLGLPAGLARKYAQQVRGKMKRMDLQRAADLVTESRKTIVEAAAEVGIAEEDLRQFMGGKRRRRKNDIAEIQQKLTWQYKSTSSKNAALFRRLMDMLEDADVSGKQIEEILDHAENLTRQQGRAIKDWRDRFRAKVKNGHKAA